MPKSAKDQMRFVMLAGSCVMLMGCAAAGGANNDPYDPYESYNRAVFSFNEHVDSAVINPTITAYRAVVPNPLRQGIKNFLFNLKSPVRFTNQILQGDVDGAGNELFRTVVNTMVGAGGLFDVAAMEGYEAEKEDFGQTLGVWGVDHGPYVVVPFLGPSSLRDYVGYAVDGFADPIGLWADNVEKTGRYYTKGIVEYINLRDDLKDVLEELNASSIDYYAAARSSYFQNRDALVADDKGAAPAGAEIPEYGDDEDLDF